MVGEKVSRKKQVTILMGVYNASQTIDKSIQSILCQSYREWVLLICDDGSEDNTVEILQRYKRMYPQKLQVYLNHENRGLTYSLNRLLGYVQTEYIARMDADDICRADRLSKQVEFLQNHKEYAFVGTSVYKFDEDGIYGIRHCKEKPVKEDLLWNNPFVHPSVMIRTEILKKVNGYRDIKKTVRCEDYDLWFRLYKENYRGYNISEPLLNYYEGRDSFPKRKFKYRINEMKVRLEGYAGLSLLPRGYIWAVKPVVLSMIPTAVMAFIKEKKWRRQNV